MAKATDYKLIRSKRKTMALCITKEVAVVVRAPLKMPEAEIRRFVASKQHWIDKYVVLREAQLKERETFVLTYGSALLLRGRETYIIEDRGHKRGFADGGFYLPPGMGPELIKPAVLKEYKKIAKKDLTSRVAFWAERTGFQPTEVRINSAKTRWGSCSARNSLNFSWRLIMAEDDVIDYVVVHELAHIKEHNHSERFWAAVGKVLPDYKARQAKLRVLQSRLACEDWDAD